MVVLDSCALSEYFDLYADMLLRIAFHYVGNQADAEDVVQDVFMKLYTYCGAFESRDHVKYWLIRSTANRSKSLLRSAHRRRTVPFEEEWPARTRSQTNTLELIQKLDSKYRDALYLHYYEGYKAAEIAEIYSTTANTVNTWLKRGREKLKLLVEEEGYEY